MSIEDTARAAKAAGMTYGQYVDALERGLILPPRKGEQDMKWTQELKDEVRRCMEQGMAPAETAEKLGIDLTKVEAQMRHLKYPEKPRAKQPVPTNEPVKTESPALTVKQSGIFDATGPMCLLSVLKAFICDVLKADEIVDISASRSLSSVDISYTVGGQMWFASFVKSAASGAETSESGRDK